MSFPRYDEYRDSGVEWLGQVPAHWQLMPLWTHFRRTKRVGYQQEQLLSVYRDLGVVPKSSRSDNFNKPSDDLSTYQLVEPGDLAINKMKAWQGSVAISGYRGIVSPAYFVYRPLHAADSRFLHYLMRSAHYVAAYLSLSKGIRVNQWDLQPELHSRLPLLMPPPHEQVAIADFLDRETGKIDALIAEQQQLIALLTEKRRAVIARAVTRGLNPDVPMKPSGVEWVGEVPAHWSTAPLYTRYEAVLGKMLDEKRNSGRYPLPYLRNADVNWDRINVSDLPEMDILPQEVERYTLRPGDVLVCEGGAGVGQTALWRGELEHCAFQKALHRLRPLSSREEPRFLCYSMRFTVESGAALYAGNTSTIPHLTSEKLRTLRLPCPPLEEQTAVADALDDATAMLDAAIGNVEAAISLLQERRTAVSSAAVTGKIDVRSLVGAEAVAA